MSNEIELLPKSSIIAVSFEVALPENATKEEILEWISYSLDHGSISIQNPLSKHGMSSIGEPVLHDTLLYLHQSSERTDQGWRIKKWKEKSPYNGEDQLEKVLRDMK